MRKKAENVQRDLFARLFAATRAAELIATHEARRAGVRRIRVESEIYEGLDDVVEKVGEDSGPRETRAWQVKRQYTPIPITVVVDFLRALADHSDINLGTFAVPVPIEVMEVGELRILGELCTRLGRGGAAIDEILSDLRVQEAKWMQCLQAAIGDDSPRATAERLVRFRVKFIGDEETLRELLRERLETRFRAPVEPLAAALTEYFAKVDGTVDVSYEVLEKEILCHHPRVTSGAFDDAYRGIIDRIENRLWLPRWNVLSDTLIRNLVPTEFVDDVAELSFSMVVQPWPGDRPELEQAIREVATRAQSYIGCFMSNHEAADSKVLRENLAYKRRWDHVAYAQGRKRSDEWDQECLKRLYNLVLALNTFAGAVRATVNPRYRIVEGDFAVVDSLGFRNDMVPASYHPKAYELETALTFARRRA